MSLIILLAWNIGVILIVVKFVYFFNVCFVLLEMVLAWVSRIALIW